MRMILLSAALRMKTYGKLVASIGRHSPYLEWAREGKTPDEIKQQVLAVLEPHFEHPERLAGIPVSVLAHEAVTINRIQRDRWASVMFAGILSEYRGALARDSKACLARDRVTLTSDVDPEEAFRM